MYLVKRITRHVDLMLWNCGNNLGLEQHAELRIGSHSLYVRYQRYPRAARFNPFRRWYLSAVIERSDLGRELDRIEEAARCRREDATVS